MKFPLAQTEENKFPLASAINSLVYYYKIPLYPYTGTPYLFKEILTMVHPFPQNCIFVLWNNFYLSFQTVSIYSIKQFLFVLRNSLYLSYETVYICPKKQFIFVLWNSIYLLYRWSIFLLNRLCLFYKTVCICPTKQLLFILWNILYHSYETVETDTELYHVLF